MRKATWRRSHREKPRMYDRRTIRRFCQKHREEVIRKRTEAQDLEQAVEKAAQDIMAFAEGEC